MIQRNSIIWFLGIAFSLAWILFLAPIAFGPPGSANRQVMTLVCWSIAMWAPGLAALLVRRFVEHKPLRTLNLGRLGEKRMYLWAWLLPIALTILTGLLTWAVGLGKLDMHFTQIRQALAMVPGGTTLDPMLLVGVQFIAALTIGPLFNTLFALGEELGWRGFLLPSLLPMGQWRAILLSGAVWGIWHAPVILQGHNYPSHPVWGVFLMVGFCMLFGTILSWLYLRTRSPWAPALGHGSLNAFAGLPLLFLAGVDITFGATLTSLIGWIPMGLFIGWLAWTKRLPVPEAMAEQPSLNPMPAEIA